MIERLLWLRSPRPKQPLRVLCTIRSLSLWICRWCGWENGWACTAGDRCGAPNNSAGAELASVTLGKSNAKILSTAEQPSIKSIYCALRGFYRLTQQPKCGYRNQKSLPQFLQKSYLLKRKKLQISALHFLKTTVPVTMRVDGDGLFETSQTSSRPSHIVTLNNL